MNLPFKPCPRKPRAGVSGALWRLPIGTDVVPHFFFFFQMCNRLPELIKNVDAGIFSVYYSLKAKKTCTNVPPTLRCTAYSNHPQNGEIKSYSWSRWFSVHQQQHSLFAVDNHNELKVSILVSKTVGSDCAHLNGNVCCLLLL